MKMSAKICRLAVVALLSLLSWTYLGSASAGASNPSRFDRVKSDITNDVRIKLAPVVSKYCGEACEIVKIDVNIEESLGNLDDLGFEGADNPDNADYFASQVNVHLQVDDRVSTANRERLEKILLNHIQSLGLT